MYILSLQHYVIIYEESCMHECTVCRYFWLGDKTPDVTTSQFQEGEGGESLQSNFLSWRNGPEFLKSTFYEENLNIYILKV